MSNCHRLNRQEQELLKTNGIINTQELLKCASSKNKKLALANKLSLNLKYINKWVALADLARVPSIGCQYCGLVLHSGIASVFQLTQTSLYQLHRQVIRLKVASSIAQDLSPTEGEVKRWLEEANYIYWQTDN